MHSNASNGGLLSVAMATKNSYLDFLESLNPGNVPVSADGKWLEENAKKYPFLLFFELEEFHKDHDWLHVHLLVSPLQNAVYAANWASVKYGLLHGIHYFFTYFWPIEQHNDIMEVLIPKIMKNFPNTITKLPVMEETKSV